MQYLKEAGCHSVAIAIEAGNDELRNAILKRNMSRETILNACRIIREAGLSTGPIVGMNIAISTMLKLERMEVPRVLYKDLE